AVESSATPTRRTDNTDAPNPLQQHGKQRQTGQPSSPPPSRGPYTDSRSFRSRQPAHDTSPENDDSKKATPNVHEQFGLFENDPLFKTWRDRSLSSNGGFGDDSNFDIFETMFSSMSPGAFNLVDPTGLTDFITDSPIYLPQQQNQQLTANREPAITCPELWEQ